MAEGTRAWFSERRNLSKRSEVANRERRAFFNTKSELQLVRESLRELPARREPTRVRARAPRDQDASECETVDRDFASSRLRDTKQLFAVLEGHKVTSLR